MTRCDPSPGSKDNPSPIIHPLPAVLLGGVLALIIWSLYRELGTLVPVVAAGALLWPHRGQAWARTLLHLLAVLAAIWILHKVRMVVYPLLAGLLVAYWLDPLVDRLEHRRIRRSIGSLIALVPALAIGLLFFVFALPLIIEQLGELVSAIPGIYDSLYGRIRPWVETVIPAEGATRWRELLTPVGPHIETILRGLWGGASGLGKGISVALGFLGMLVLAPILTYYLLVDFDRLRTWLPSIVPESRRAAFLQLTALFEQTVSSYFRGQVLVSLCVAVLFSAGFLLIGLPYALVLGLLAGVLNLVPVIGFWTSTVLCVAAAILSGTPGTMLLRLGIVLVVEQIVESQVLTPRIVGRAVGLNPAAILLAVLACGALLGPLGVVLAVPAAAFLRGVLEQRRTGAGPGRTTKEDAPTATT